jgi:uncharacterized membrane protein (DUF4010 family)
MAAMVASLLVAAWWILRTDATPQAEADPVPVRNPFHLKRALAWGLALAAMLLVSAAARTEFGDRGLMVAAALSGVASETAITLAVSSQVKTVALPAATAVLAIVLAIGASTLAKAGFAWISGGRAFGLRLTAVLAVSFGVTLAAALIPF